jgi:hypothetical protein
LPFSNGALLNIGPIAQYASPQAFSVDTATVSNQDIKNLLHNSRLGPVIEIKRDEIVLEELINQLVKLINSSTLDSGQMKSLFGALGHPVHLTQGPPGNAL